MSVHIKNGTPLHGPSLCETCSHSHIVKGYRASEQLVICRAQEPVHQVEFAVHECTDYRDRTRQSLWEMERIAWVLAPQGPKGKAGFVPSSEGSKGEDEIELILNKEN
jgi:hypothetical protein